MAEPAMAESDRALLLKRATSLREKAREHHRESRRQRRAAESAWAEYAALLRVFKKLGIQIVEEAEPEEAESNDER